MPCLTARHLSHLGTSGLEGASTSLASPVSTNRRNDSTVSLEVLREYRNEFAQSLRTSLRNSSALRYLHQQISL